MPITYEIHPTLNVVLLKCFGLATVETYIDVLLSYVEDPGFDPDYHLLFDKTGCEHEHDDYKRMTKLAAALQPLFNARADSSRTSIYCPTDVLFAYSRVYGAVSETWTPRKIGIFRAKDEALRFVFVDPDNPKAIAAFWPPPV